MNKNLILDHFITKTTSIKKVNQQHSLLIACVLSEFNPSDVKVLLNLYTGLIFDLGQHLPANCQVWTF